MAKLTTIDEIPVFSTPREAKSWGLKYGLRSYHIHYFEGEKGYMSGATHDYVKKVVEGSVIPNITYSSGSQGGGTMGGGGY